MHKGQVKWFNQKKGFGFIKDDNGEDDIFIHYSNIVSDGFKSLVENDMVEFNIVSGLKCKSTSSET